MAIIDQEPLLIVLLDLRKAYDMLDLVCLLNTLEGYGVVPKLRGILEEFWENQEVVKRHGGYHGLLFRKTRGTTQGGAGISHTLQRGVINCGQTLALSESG